MADWPLHEAKNKLSTLVDQALTDGPQTITRHGEGTVIVLSLDTYRRLAGQYPTLEDLLLAAPEDIEIDLDDYIGPRSPGRAIDLG